MKQIKTKWEGIELVGEIVSQTEWDYSVRLIEPFHSWEGTSHIPTFARGITRNYIGEYGQDSIKGTLIRLYKQSELFYGKLPGLKVAYKDYREEMQAILDLPFGVHSRIEYKLNKFFMDSIFGSNNWTMDEKIGVMEILKNEYK